MVGGRACRAFIAQREAGQTSPALTLYSNLHGSEMTSFAYRCRQLQLRPVSRALGGAGNAGSPFNQRSTCGDVVAVGDAKGSW